MGADMIIECFWEEINAKGLPVKKPDWKKGKAKIKELCSKWLADGELPSEVDFLANGDKFLHRFEGGVYTIEDQVASVQVKLIESLEEIKQAYTGNHRELTSLEFRPYRVFITGGMSWGDSPSTLFNTLQTLTELEILEATGLNPNLPDTLAIVKKLVKSEELQPLLIGKDEDLDKMLDIEMRKSKRKHK